MLKFSKLREGAIIPSKREEDAGYDLYPCFKEPYIIIPAHSNKLIPTGLAGAFEKDLVMLLRERGSTGTKQMAVRAGVVDSGYRNEIFVSINNTSAKAVVICKASAVNSIKKKPHYSSKNVLIFPYEKAIAQFLMVPAMHFEVEEVSYDALRGIESERGMECLGSTDAKTEAKVEAKPEAPVAKKANAPIVPNVDEDNAALAAAAAEAQAVIDAAVKTEEAKKAAAKKKPTAKKTTTKRKVGRPRKTKK